MQRIPFFWAAVCPTFEFLGSLTAKNSTRRYCTRCVCAPPVLRAHFRARFKPSKQHQRHRSCCRRNTMPRAVYNEPLAGTPPPSPRDNDDSVSIDSAGLAGDWDDDDEDYELEPDPSDDDEEPASTSTAAAPPVATATAANTAPPVAATAPARKRGQKTSNASQLANVAKRQSKKEPKVSPQEIQEGWTQHVKSVVDMPFCKASNGSRNSKC